MIYTPTHSRADFLFSVHDVYNDDAWREKGLKGAREPGRMPPPRQGGRIVCRGAQGFHEGCGRQCCEVCLPPRCGLCVQLGGGVGETAMVWTTNRETTTTAGRSGMHVVRPLMCNHARMRADSDRGGMSGADRSESRMGRMVQVKDYRRPANGRAQNLHFCCWQMHRFCAGRSWPRHSARGVCAVSDRRMVVMPRMPPAGSRIVGLSKEGHLRRAMRRPRFPSMKHFSVPGMEKTD
ncbi:hypothetical protein QBC39DRAFT_10735 [Podospora conica]|nr:hypothetical protein QBC39DRAFT_10735 [Schizothecium conicum]